MVVKTMTIYKTVVRDLAGHVTNKNNAIVLSYLVQACRLQLSVTMSYQNLNTYNEHNYLFVKYLVALINIYLTCGFFLILLTKF
jgi:hypothetical protein